MALKPQLFSSRLAVPMGQLELVTNHFRERVNTALYRRVSDFITTYQGHLHPLLSFTLWPQEKQPRHAGEDEWEQCWSEGALEYLLTGVP